MPDRELRTTHERVVEEGTERLARTWPGLLATGSVGAVDVGLGLLALLIVLEVTGNPLLAAAAFGIGFIAVIVSRSELFTENFLVPIAAVLAGRKGFGALLRLWGGTLVANLAAGWLMMGLIVVAMPRLREVAVQVAMPFVEMSLLSLVGSSILAGAAITLMTWMEHRTEAMGARMGVALAVGFLVAAGPLPHPAVASMDMFAALQIGAPFGYADWAARLPWIVFGNAIGGIGLVTVLRLIQVGPDSLAGRP